MTIHELKTWPEFFQAMLDRLKTFDARKATDRDFKFGDVLLLREWTPADSIHSALGEYSGRYIKAEVTYILHGSKGNVKCGIREGYCVMGIKILETGKQT